jgi:hypothetical protein
MWSNLLQVAVIGLMMLLCGVDGFTVRPADAAETLRR